MWHYSVVQYNHSIFVQYNRSGSVQYNYCGTTEAVYKTTNTSVVQHTYRGDYVVTQVLYTTPIVVTMRYGSSAVQHCIATVPQP